MTLTENSSSVKVTKSVLGVITFPSFKITLKDTDAGIMDGLGGFLPSIPTDMLGHTGADLRNSTSQSGRFDKSDVKHFPFLNLACLGVKWSPLSRKLITLHTSEPEVFFAVKNIIHTHMNIRKQFFSLKNLTIDTSLENDNFKYPLNKILQQV